MTSIRLSAVRIAGVTDLQGTKVVGLAGGVQDVVSVHFDVAGEIGLVDTLEALEDFAADLTAALVRIRDARRAADPTTPERIPGP